MACLYHRAPRRLPCLAGHRGTRMKKTKPKKVEISYEAYLPLNAVKINLFPGVLQFFDHILRVGSGKNGVAGYEHIGSCGYDLANVFEGYAAIYFYKGACACFCDQLFGFADLIKGKGQIFL